MKTAGLAGAALITIAACGGAESARATTAGPLEEETAPPPSRPVAVNGSREVRATVGSAGGTLSLSNGARLEIPPGALDHEIEIALEIGADGHAFGDRERQRPLGPMLSVTPALLVAEGHELVLSIPELPVPNGFQRSDLAFGMEEVDEAGRAIETLATQTRWEFYPVEVDGGRFLVRTRGLAGNRVQFGVAR